MTGGGEGRTIVLVGAYAPSLILFRGKLIEALVARGHRVVAVASAIPPDVAAKLEAIGAEPVSIAIANQSLNPFSALSIVRRLERLFRRVRADAVIAYTVKPVVLGAIAARRAGVRDFVAMITGLGFALIEGPGLKRRFARAAASLLYRNALRTSRAAIFQNPDDRDHFRAAKLLPPALPAIIVGGSGIDLDAFAPAPLPEGVRFLMISRLLGDKGVREYLRAAVRVKRRHPQVGFALVGYFDDSPDAIAQEELDAAVAGGVDFLGRRDDVRPAIAEANVYVLPSYHEGTPRSVLEAMAMGRAVITTDAPGCRQTVDPGVNGLLVAPRSADSLAEAMEQLIVKPARIAAMGAQSRRIAEQRFDVDKVNAAVLAAAGL